MQRGRALALTPPYPSKQISEAIAGVEGVINLSISEPWFAPPPAVRESLRAYGDDPDLNEHVRHYGDSLGLLQLRQAIASRYKAHHGMDVDPAQILVTAGGANAVSLAILAGSDVDDAIIVGDPSYVLYGSVAALLGRAVIRVPTIEDSFVLTAKRVEKAISDRAKMIILSSPENPTGSMIDRAGLSALLDLARERGLIVVHDETYDSFARTTAHVPALHIAPDVAIMVNTFSKRFAMPGWRLGWLAASAPFVSYVAKAHNYLSLATSGIAQTVGANVLTDPRTSAEVSRNAAAVADRIELAHRALRDLPGVELPEVQPQGGLFIFPRVSGLARLIDRERADAEGAGQVVADWALHEGRVAMVPGGAYGPGGREYVRIVVGVEMALLEEALRRLSTMAQSVLPRDHA